MYISMKFGTGVHVFCWEVGVFNRSSFPSVSYKSLNFSSRLEDSEVPCTCVAHDPRKTLCDVDLTENYMYISMKFGTGVHVFCWEVGVFNCSSFQSVSYKSLNFLQGLKIVKCLAYVLPMTRGRPYMIWV